MVNDFTYYTTELALCTSNQLLGCYNAFWVEVISGTLCHVPSYNTSSHDTNTW